MSRLPAELCDFCADAVAVRAGEDFVNHASRNAEVGGEIFYRDFAGGPQLFEQMFGRLGCKVAGPAFDFFGDAVGRVGQFGRVRLLGRSGRDLMEERGDGVLRLFRLLRGGTVDNEVAVEGVAPNSSLRSSSSSSSVSAMMLQHELTPASQSAMARMVLSWSSILLRFSAFMCGLLLLFGFFLKSWVEFVVFAFFAGGMRGTVFVCADPAVVLIAGDAALLIVDLFHFHDGSFHSTGGSRS